MLASYHNHTDWSDGAASIEAMVDAGTRLRLDEIGISDHWVVDPTGVTPRWSMNPDSLNEYVAHVSAVGRRSATPVRVGAEVDWFPDCGDRIAAGLEGHGFDLLIGSVHTVRGFRVDSAASTWAALPLVERDAKHRQYWRAIAGMAQSGLFDIVGHLDLPKKFNQRCSEPIDDEISVALDAIAAANMAVELNTSGWHAPCRDAYPSLDLLLACRARDIPVLLSADAHAPEDLRRDFGPGAERLRRAGYREVVTFERRRRRAVAIADQLDGSP